MSTFNLQWSPTNLPSLSRERYAQFFALELDGEVLFLGMAYLCDLAQLIPACILQHDLDPLRLTIYLGRIREVGEGRISSASVTAIHELLVFARKPRLNLAGKHLYQGASDLQVSNSGWRAIPHRVRAENKYVFVAKAVQTPMAHPIPAC